MKLSRKWLNEFIDLSLEEKNDRDFAEAMTMSGSKVEGTDYKGEGDRKSTRLNSSHGIGSRMPSSA